MHSTKSIKARLERNDKAVFRAIVVLLNESLLTGYAAVLATKVIAWNAKPQKIKEITQPLSEYDTNVARCVSLDFAYRLTEIANENEQYEAEARAEREAEIAAERYYENRNHNPDCERDY